jgi:hypothetical protein
MISYQAMTSPSVAVCLSPAQRSLDRLLSRVLDAGGNRGRLLLDSRVVDLLMAHTPTFVMLAFLKPLFFNSLKNAFRFSDNAGA